MHNIKLSSPFQLALIDRIFTSMPGKVTYLSEPHVKERRCTCVLRPMTVKEIQQHEKKIKNKQQVQETMEKNKADHQDEKMQKNKDEQQDDKMQKIKDEQQDNGKDLTDSDSHKH